MLVILESGSKIPLMAVLRDGFSYFKSPMESAHRLEPYPPKLLILLGTASRTLSRPR